MRIGGSAQLGWLCNTCGRELAKDLLPRRPGFAVNAETGLQAMLLGYSVEQEQMPISWINRTPGMSVSSLRLANVGGGYWHFLMDFGSGAFSGLVRIATFPSMEVASVTPALKKQTGARTQICLSQQNIARRALK